MITERHSKGMFIAKANRARIPRRFQQRFAEFCQVPRVQIFFAEFSAKFIEFQ